MSEIAISRAFIAATDDVANAVAVPAAAVCVTCGSPEARTFCPACGQRTRRERFTVRTIARDVASDVLNLDRGLLHTAVEMSRRPGMVVAEYVHGRTVPYTGPVKYFLILAAVTTLLYANTGIAEATVAMYGMTPPSASASLQAKTMEFVTTWLNLIMALGVPFQAAYTRLLFRRVGYNFAEHLILNTYVYAQVCLIFLAVLVPLHAAGVGMGSATLLYMGLTTAFTAWAGVQFFRAPPVSGTLRMVAAFVLGYVTYMVFAMVVGIVLGVAWALATR